MMGGIIPDRIVIADDHPLFLEAVSLNLRQIFPETALERVESYPALIGLLSRCEREDMPALIMMDLNMPGMTALDGLKSVLTIVKGAPVVVVSGSEDTRLIRHILSLGVAGYVPKSLDISAIEEAAHAALDCRQYRPPGIPAMSMQAEAYVDRDAQRMEGALNRLSTGIIYLDRHLHIQFMNTVASRILLERHGMMTGQDGVLRVLDKQQSARFARMVGDVVQGGQDAFGALTLKGERGDRISIVATAVAPGSTLEVGEAMVFVTDHGNYRPPEANVLAELYGLTDSEARVLRELVQGQSPEAIAGALSVAVNTVRSHLKAIYNKTGTRRQAELVSLVMIGPATMAARTAPD